MTGKFYKVNRLEYIASSHRRVYYCPGNIVIDNGNAININKNNMNDNLGTNVLLDNGVIVNAKEKKIKYRLIFKRFAYLFRRFYFALCTQQVAQILQEISV